MITTIEISLYPFQQNFRKPIKAFLAKLNEHEGVKITTGPTSTVMIGEHTQVMKCLDEMLLWNHTHQGKSVLVAKFILDYDPS